jgi:hypothetical protein
MSKLGQIPSFEEMVSVKSSRFKCIGIYTSPTAPSPKGEGWDEGNVNA